jgi:hypothetical protein
MFRIIILAFMLFGAVIAKATIYTVNNSSTSPGQYTNVAAAVSAASNGDTIYISGSSVNYGSFTINKRLTVIGTGHNPQKQAPLYSLVDNITISSNGVRIMGLNAYHFDDGGSNIDSIYISRNFIRYRIIVDNSNPDHWYIEGNVFEYSGENITFCSTCNITFMYISNNVFNGQLKELNYNGNNGNIYVSNNIFLRNGDMFTGSNYYLYIYNNIFYRATPSSSSTSCTWAGNCSYQCANNTFPSGTNFTNINPRLIDFPNGGAYFSYSHNYRLQDTSQLVNAGTDGRDVGISGGSGYFEINGIPNIPQIRSFSITSNTTIPSGGSLNISFKSTIKR